MKKQHLTIYGDNIVECNRMIELIESGFNVQPIKSVNTERPFAPILRYEWLNELLTVQFCPDYKTRNRWLAGSFFDHFSDGGTTLSEAPDVIVTRKIVDSSEELVILAVEFSSAIPAGNQAWQRSGRALSLSELSVPYLYITDIGLTELDENRNVKAVRSSNPLVPLSYLKNTQRADQFTLYIVSTSVVFRFEDESSEFVPDNELIELVNAIVFDEDYKDIVYKLSELTVAYLNQYDNVPESIDFKDWLNVEDVNIERYITKFNISSYRKTVAKKTPIKDEMRRIVVDVASKYAVSLFNNIPICMIPTGNRTGFSEGVISQYGKLRDNVQEWLKKERPLVLVLINGFKPRGDDARPDRGLVPFARMLFGFEIDLLTIVFGQATEAAGQSYVTDPKSLSNSNGLWKSILEYSSLTIADSVHWNIDASQIATFMMGNHNIHANNKVQIPIPRRLPRKFNENDLDSTIHLKMLNSKIFEGLCNPPGGDWSGISLIDANWIEHRWISLPRLSVKSKRPDHVFQTQLNSEQVLIIIESKESLRGLQNDIESLGVGLSKYVNSLISIPCNAIKDTDGTWNSNDSNVTYDISFDHVICGAAYIKNKCTDLDESKKIRCDFILEYQKDTFELIFLPLTLMGKIFGEIIENHGLDIKKCI